MPQQNKYLPRKKYLPQQNKYLPQQDKYLPQQTKYLHQQIKYLPQQNKYLPQQMCNRERFHRALSSHSQPLWKEVDIFEETATELSRSFI